MADSTALLKRRGGQTSPGVRIPPSPFIPEAAAITWWWFFRCDVSMFDNLLCVLKTVLAKNRPVPKANDSITEHPGCRR